MDELNGLPLASFKRRAAAYMIDGAVVGIVSLMLHGFHLREGQEAACGSTWLALGSALGEKVKELAESVLYFGIALKVGNGQTIGKHVMKIRVLSLTQDGISWWTAIERALGYGASLLEGGFGFFQYYLNKNRMCVHDRIAETIVIDLRKPRTEPPTEHLADVDDAGDAMQAAM